MHAYIFSQYLAYVTYIYLISWN